MGDVAQFIILSAVNDYISHDYEHCTKTCLINFKETEKENLFKANLHRLNSLA